MHKGLIAIISFFLTAFILVVGVSVVNATTLKNATQTQNAVNDMAPAQEEVLLQQMNERETAYRQLIADANTRIENLNQQVVSLNDSATQNAAQTTLAPEQAANIALLAVNNEDTLTQLPELVNYEGRPAYEVKMTNGVLYIDAETGEILFNSVPQRINEEKAAEIAGVYLGGMDPRYAVVKKMILNGSEIFQVNFNNYIVYIDPFGGVIKAQVYRYVADDSSNNNNSSSSSSSTSSSSHDDDDHEDEHDDD